MLPRHFSSPKEGIERPVLRLWDVPGDGLQAQKRELKAMRLLRCHVSESRASPKEGIESKVKGCIDTALAN